jgi:hypothetical protein
LLSGRNRIAAEAARDQEILTMFNSFVSHARDRIAKRKRYNRLVNEIYALSDRDLADLNSSRTDMLYHVHREVYGR